MKLTLLTSSKERSLLQDQLAISLHVYQGPYQFKVPGFGQPAPTVMSEATLVEGLPLTNGSVLLDAGWALQGPPTSEDVKSAQLETMRRYCWLWTLDILHGEI